MGRFSVSQPAKRCSASSRKLLPKPHRFMLTGVSPGRSVQLSPPSSVKCTPFSYVSMRVRSVTLCRVPSGSVTHTPRATLPFSETVFRSR